MGADILGTVGGMGVLASSWASLCVSFAGVISLGVMWGVGVALSWHTGVVAVAAVSLLALVFGTQVAEASYEKVGVFAADGSGEGELGEYATGVAVNHSTGEVYVSDGFNANVSRFGLRGNFLGAWGWDVIASGPDKGTGGFEDCVHVNKDVCTKGTAGEGEGELGLPGGIAVDQITGNVYVFDRERKQGVVQEFSSDGEHIIASFGVRGGGILSEGNPEKIREPLSIAVDASGDVYVGDSGVNPAGLEGRVMVFHPKAGSEYKEYEYTGELAKGHVPSQIGVDSLGDVFVGTEGVVYKFAPGTSSTLVCESGKYVRLGGLAVSPVGGEVFVYSNSNSMFYRLSSSCEQVEEFSGVAKEKETSGLAFNPVLVWGSCVNQVGGRFVDGLSLLGSSSDPNGCSEEGVGGGFELVDERLPGVLYGVNPGNPEVLHSGLVFAPAVVRPPVVVGVGVSGVGSGSVTFGARIDTRDFVTHYRFLYYSDAVGSVCSVVRECEAPVGGGVLRAGEESVGVSVGGLLPGVVYHYRVVGFSDCSANPTVECVLEGGGVEHEFRTFGLGVGLPDGRAYELVSPVLKDGGEVFPADPFAADCEECLPGITSEHFPEQSDVSGDRVVYEGDAFAVDGGAINENEYVASRGGDGWVTSDLSPVDEVKDPPQGYKAFSTDLSVGVLDETEPSLVPEPEAPAGYPNIYAQDTATGGLRAVIGGKPPFREPSGTGRDEFQAGFEGASSDFSHVVFAANDALVSGAGTLEKELASDVASEVAKNENNDYLYEWFDGGIGLVGVLPVGEGGTVVRGASFDAVSGDGSRVYFSGESGQMFVRVDGERTFKVPDASGFVSASVDGSRVLLADGDVYEVNEAEEKFDLVGSLTGGDGGFLGVLGASSDLSSVYFVDTELLAGKNVESKEPVKGGDNLYLSRGGLIVFVGTLASADDGDGTAFGVLSGETGDWVASASHRTARVTPDGDYAAFMSAADLTGYESDGNFEVFEYDAGTERLACASCNPTGEHPVGSSTLSLFDPSGMASLQAPLNLSENGRVFFDSTDVLSPQDANRLENVYEYEPDGLGTCEQEGGCVFLISSGTGETNAQFVNATPSGEDVFFTTRSQLVPQDKDEQIDLYDARAPHVPGEQVVFPPEAGSSECSSGGECQSSSSSSPPPDLGSPLSMTLSGMGNLLAPRPPAPPPPSEKPPAPSLTRAQELARALKVCQRQRNRKKRAACVAKARKRYATKAETKTAANAGIRRRTRTTQK